ncbi:MAG TPA: alpha-amylase family glycosyl hydrolase [Marmoricola sp.]|nr:alpha-amylase family glycosyl hydrolase [Marmoricola sp.]
MRDPHWWRQAVVYQIYPRSFADANGDGIGDLGGVLSRVPYLAELGVDAVWLSPFYPSELADGGYDVADHRDVDPRLGTLAEFDAMVDALHAVDIKVVVDIVPNHTSDQHAWFQEALKAPAGSAARDRYIFRDGRGPDGSEPPSDWESVFGGPAWQRTPDGQWYHHIFAPEQPDLNWESTEVREDFLRTLRFWSDRGVDGFRVDVAHGLVKDLSEPYRPNAEMGERSAADGDHPWWDRDEVHEVYAEWRRVFDEYDPPRTAVAEAWVADHRRARYASPEGLGQAFNFSLLEADWDARTFRRVITDSLRFAERTGASSTWVLSNHDVVRHASRYGLPAGEPTAVARGWLGSGGKEPILDRERGVRRARAATLLMLALPGSSYLYQGEELGLHEVADLPGDQLQDPTWERSGRTFKGRDGCRVPLPWADRGPSYGFGDAAAHLPQPDWFAEEAVSVQQRDESSTLSLYRAALRLRRELQGPEELGWLEGSSGTLHLARPAGWESVTNFDTRPVPLPAGDVLLSSEPLDGDGLLPGETTVWLRT